MDECRRGPTPRRRSHLSRACKSVEQEEDEDVVEDEGEENEVEEEEEQEEAEEGPTNEDDEDGEEVEDVAEGAAYQPMEVAEAAAEAAVEQAVVTQIDHSIEERVKRIRDIWDVPESPMGEPPSSINKGLTSRPSLSPTSTVHEESPPAIAGPATCPPAPVTPPQTPRKSASPWSRSNSVRVKRRLLERWRSLAAIQARRSAWRSFSSIMKQLDDGY